MSAIASFTRLPKSALGGSPEAAVVKKRLFGAPKDSYDDYLQAHGQTVANYSWSGFVLATLLVYLEEQHGIDLMTSEYGSLAEELSQTRHATIFVLTAEHKRRYLEKLTAGFNTEELRDHYNAFNETSEPGAGRPMLDGIESFRNALAAVDDDSVVLVSIG